MKELYILVAVAGIYLPTFAVAQVPLQTLRTCLKIEDQSKERLNCYDEKIAPAPKQVSAPAKTVRDCRFVKEEDKRLNCFNRFVAAPAPLTAAPAPVAPAAPAPLAAAPAPVATSPTNSVAAQLAKPWRHVAGPISDEKFMEDKANCAMMAHMAHVHAGAPPEIKFPDCMKAEGYTSDDRPGVAQNVLKIISGDKAKTQIYCDMAKLGDQIEQAGGRKGTKKTDELYRQMNELRKQLGPEYVALIKGTSGYRPGIQRRSRDRFGARGAR